jgi:hypothetical protein
MKINKPLSILMFATANQFFVNSPSHAQEDTIKLTNERPVLAPDSPIEMKKDVPWYENIKLRGYMQLRYNRLLETNPDLGCEQCDRSWGNNGGFFFRRIRMIFFGQIHPRVFLYIQPDFASSASATGLHFAQIRDAYFDVGLDKKNEFRFRIGQSKVPFGFENMQSSQNRLPLDRHDAMNSAVSNERDLGIFFYWAPKKIRDRFSMLVRDGYKGSGDYGVFGFGAYNGQLANRPEMNNSQHLVMRLTYPFEYKGQIFEPSIQAYTGMFTIDKSQVSAGVSHRPDLTYTDKRIAVTSVLYPRPVGFQAEYNWGVGPEYNKFTNTIESAPLQGGYVTFNARLPYKDQLIYPFVRMQYYEGGKKHERDARSYRLNEYEFGIEWLPYKNFEIVAMYTFSSRRYEDGQKTDNKQVGSLLRLQFQVNF